MAVLEGRRYWVGGGIGREDFNLNCVQKGGIFLGCHGKVAILGVLGKL